MPTSYSAQDMAIAIDQLTENIAVLSTGDASIRMALGEIAATLQAISHMLSKEYLLEDVLTTQTLNTSNLRLDRLGRHYLCIFTPTQVTAVVATIMGVAFTFNLVVGWNTLNFPDGTILTGPTGSNQLIIIKATNWVQAGAI